MPSTSSIITAFDLVIKRAAVKIGCPPHLITPAQFWMTAKGEISEWSVRKCGGYFSLKSGLYPEPKAEEKIFVPDTEKLRGRTKKGSVYVVTSAQAGVAANMRFFRSLLHYCKVKKAELLIIPLNGKDKGETSFDPKLVPYLLRGDVRLNNNVKVSMLEIRPTMADPLLGLQRFTENSTIFGSPKLALKPVPVSNRLIPKIIMSTGAVTHPSYARNRVGRIATQDHVFSAIVVEIVDSKLFHFRQLMSDVHGNFCDLDKKYTPTKAEKAEIEAIVLGDIHVGSECPLVMKATEEMRKVLRPKRVCLHDIFDGLAINRHHIDDVIIKAQKAEVDRNDLKTEYRRVYDFLIKQASLYKEVLVVASNHDLFTEKFLKSGAFINDPQNYRIALELSLGLLDGKTALETFMRKVDMTGKLKNVSFLKTSDDYSIESIIVSNHGHLGSGGARGSIKSSEIGSTSAVIGHSHSPHIYHKIFQVGTSTKLRLDYNDGFSSWVNTHCLIFKNGTRQLVNVIGGKWKL